MVFFSTFQRCVDEKFRADKEVVLLAVNQCGHTLAFASEMLKAWVFPQIGSVDPLETESLQVRPSKTWKNEGRVLDLFKKPYFYFRRDISM